VQAPPARYISEFFTTISWRVDFTDVFSLCAIISIAPTTSVSAAPYCLDRHPVLLSFHFPSSEQCHIPKGRFFEYISGCPFTVAPALLARANLDRCWTHFSTFQLHLRSCAPSDLRAFHFMLHFSGTRLPVALCSAALLHFNGVWCSMRNYSPVGVTNSTSIYCYDNLTGLTGNCVVLWKGEHSPASISMAPRHSPYPSTLHTFQWRPDHFSGPLRLVVWW